MIEPDEIGISRTKWLAREAFHAGTTPDALAKEQRELAGQGKYVSTEDLLRGHINTLLDVLDQEDE